MKIKYKKTEEKSEQLKIENNEMKKNIKLMLENENSEMKKNIKLILENENSKMKKILYHK